jgi:hypothetical protein
MVHIVISERSKASDKHILLYASLSGPSIQPFSPQLDLGSPVH